MMNPFLELDDDDYWAAWEKVRKPMVRALQRSGKEGMTLGAPSRVDLRGRDTVPVWIGYRFKAARMDSLAITASALLVTSRHQDRRVECAPLDQDDDLQVPPDGVAAAPQPPPSGFTSNVFSADIKELVPSESWRAGDMTVALLVQGISPEPVSMHLVSEDVGDTDPAVQEFLSEHRSVGYPRPIYPAANQPGYESYKQSHYLEAPEHEGVVLQADQEEVGCRAEGAIIRGAFRLPVLAREVVRPPGSDNDPYAERAGAGWVDVGDQHASAVVPISLVAAGDGAEMPAAPVVIRLQVPVYGEVQAGELAEGHFSINVMQLNEMQRIPQQYHLYAFAGSSMSAPCALRLLEED